MSTRELTNPSPNRRVLVVEDEPRLRQMLLRAIPDMGFEAMGAGTGEEALRIIGDQPAAIAILDLNLPGIDGMKLFEKLRESLPNLQVIIMTGYGDLEAAQQAIRLGVADFLTKPCSLGDLEHALDRAWRRCITQPERSISARPATISMAPLKEQPADSDAPRTLQNVEKDLILAALDRNEGNRSATARELGISVRTLYYRLSQYDLNAE
jgi:DNA-binding NtrC family response regulator